MMGPSLPDGGTIGNVALILPEIGQAPAQLEQPAAFNSALSGFLERVARR